MKRALVAGFAAAMLLAGPALAETLELTVRSAEPVLNELTGQPSVQIELDEASAKAWTAFTVDNVGDVVELLVDGKVITAPRIQEPILGASVMLSADYLAQANDLASLLSSGEPIVVRRQGKEKVQ